MVPDCHFHRNDVHTAHSAVGGWGGRARAVGRGRPRCYGPNIANSVVAAAAAAAAAAAVEVSRRAAFPEKRN